MPASDPERYVPDRPLPPYRYLPGGDAPHPWRHPGGWAYAGGRPPAPPELAPGSPAWREEFLHGVDLFNRGYLWEAHEAWEGLWHGAAPGSAVAEILRGLIQAAAALIKREQGHPRARDRLLAAARDRLERRAPEAPLLADHDAFLAALDAHLHGPADPPLLVPRLPPAHRKRSTRSE